MANERYGPMSKTKGRRIYPNEKGELLLSFGDYGFHPRAQYWMGRPPGQHAGSFPEHDVVEHEDGTITVSPSILLTDENGKELWHGYLEQGYWREV